MPADDQPWTTSRCNRLLRPISSRLATLRKELDQQRSITGENTDASILFSREHESRGRAASRPSGPRARKTHDKARDPDWLFEEKKRVAGAKRTYGGRPRKTSKDQISENAPTHARPGEIAFTPFVVRSANILLETPQWNASPLRRRKKGSLVANLEHIQKLKKQMRSDVGKLVEGLLDAYAKLLQATHVQEGRSRKGTRSLMSSCLDKIPAYIELEDHFARLDAEEADEDMERDLTNEIYDHLDQTFASSNDQGWKHFRDIVRAHGTSLLCDAFEDDILGPDALHAVVDICLKSSEWDLAERFLWTYIPNLKPIAMPATLQAVLFEREKSIYMYLVWQLVKSTARYGFLYDILEHLIAQELLPLEWLATESMRPLWSRLVRTLSEGDQRTGSHALRLVETFICAGAGLANDELAIDATNSVSVTKIRPSTRRIYREALATTFSSLLTVLAGIALVSKGAAADADTNTMHRITCILDNLVVELLRHGDARTDLELMDCTVDDMEVFAQRALQVMTASLIVHMGGCSLSPGLVSVDTKTHARGFRWVLRNYSCEDIDKSAVMAIVPGFISSTARCAGKACQDESFDQLQQLVDAMLSLRGFKIPHRLWSMRRLAFETALEFSQTTNEVEHIAYARRIEQSLNSMGRILLTSSPHKQEAPEAGGFRWEEGIGEWVACTPFVKQHAARAPKNPIRAFSLLPSPEPSLSGIGTDRESCDSESEDEKYVLPSSPVKRPSRITTSLLGKRTRASSPMVVIPKRTRATPPNSTALSDASSCAELFEPSHALPSPASSATSRRRSSRIKSDKHIKTLSTRTRKSLDSSLRNLPPKTYAEELVSDSSETEGLEEVVDTNARRKRKPPSIIPRKRMKADGIGREGSHPFRKPSFVVTMIDDAESEDELSFGL